MRNLSRDGVTWNTGINTLELLKQSSRTEMEQLDFFLCCPDCCGRQRGFEHVSVDTKLMKVRHALIMRFTFTNTVKYNIKPVHSLQLSSHTTLIDTTRCHHHLILLH